MAKGTAFRAYDVHRTKTHAVTSPPFKINDHRLRAGEWQVTKTTPSSGRMTRSATAASKKAKRTAKALKLPSTVAGVLKYTDPEYICLQCNEPPASKSCTIKCLRTFRKQHFTHKVEIRSHPVFNYGAYATSAIPKGCYIGEYIGELRPLSTPYGSTYRYEIPGVCVIDPEEAGNWTRFINSSCRPNVKPWGETLGGRHVILFETIRNVKEGEELLFNYGKNYFERAGFSCNCDATEGEHMPGDKVKNKTNTKVKCKRKKEDEAQPRKSRRKRK